MNKWAKQIKEEAYKLSQESAEASMREFLNFYEVGVDEHDAEAAAVLGKVFDNLAIAYRRGQLENSQNGKTGFEIIQHLANGETLTYRQLATAHIKSLDGFKENERTGRVCELLGRLCGLGPDAILKMSISDFRVAELLSIPFFLAA
jgi:hypothetical protein